MRFHNRNKTPTRPVRSQWASLIRSGLRTHSQLVHNPTALLGE